MIRVPMSVDQMVDLVDSFTLKALVNIFRCIEQSAFSREKDRRSISNKPASFVASFLTDLA
jgi:hypothetical protein